MKRNHILWIVSGLVVIWILVYSFSDSGPGPQYIQQIDQARREKDISFRRDADSPFAGKEFGGLKYYPVDPRYIVQASLEKIENTPRLFLKTNDGKDRQYQQYAWAHFEIDDQPGKLLILRPYPVQLKDQFFLAFGDQTNALETYGAGRYIDLQFNPGSTRVEIDFNLAYNPFCAYDPSFSCPLPPSDNLLDIAIKAGEKNHE